MIINSRGDLIRFIASPGYAESGEYPNGILAILPVFSPFLAVITDYPENINCPGARGLSLNRLENYQNVNLLAQIARCFCEMVCYPGLEVVRVIVFCCFGVGDGVADSSIIGRLPLILLAR